MRRSLAIGGSLTRADVDQPLDACADLLAQCAAIAAVLDQLGPSFREPAPPSTSWRGSSAVGELSLGHRPGLRCRGPSRQRR